MSIQNQVLIVDAGNTSVKIGLFQEEALITVERFDISKLQNLNDWLSSFHNYSVAISSVLSEKNSAVLKSMFVHPIVITANSTFPIAIKYQSPDKLGIDRICNAVYATIHKKTKNAVIIDVGTCVKFDFVDEENAYIGGSIAPGIDLRFKSLNDYTGNLPLVSNKSATNLVGTDTETSIRSGVINGLEAEIKGIMREYKLSYDDLTFFVTGGDAHFFELHSKNDIFADENLTLKGLFEIYKHNA